MKMGLNDFSAKDVINKLDQKELEQIFRYFGEEKNRKRVYDTFQSRIKDTVLIFEA